MSKLKRSLPKRPDPLLECDSSWGAIHVGARFIGPRSKKVIVIKKRRTRNLIPAWQMPSDPVKAVLWFLFWLLRLLTNFFWLPILIMVIIETFINWSSAGGVSSGLVAGIVTLLVGLVIWAALYGVTFFLNVGTTVSRVLSDVNSIQKNFSARSSLYPFSDSASEKNVVEGTITDLDEERRKRRQSE